ncbi:MAG: NUDIX hydrolase N-terminal domain-containing protein [Pseudomonadales bacterium]|nr:NUDIX hydrolase N-terminal domain-containing protein [Pseudomonadales bacterium]
MDRSALERLKRIAALAATGAHYAAGDVDRGGGSGRFDLDRYEEIRALCAELLASRLGAGAEAVAVHLPDRSAGYATPPVDVRAAVLDGDRVLLVRERSDGRWTLPGGFADTGLTAAANVEREVAEEAGLVVRAERLYAVVHKASHGYDADVREFYKLYFLCRPTPTSPARPRPCGVETLAAAFFHRSELPELSTGRVIAEHLDLAFDFASEPHRPTLFD